MYVKILAVVFKCEVDVNVLQIEQSISIVSIRSLDNSETGKV